MHKILQNELQSFEMQMSVMLGLNELGKSDQGNCGTVTCPLVPLTLLKKSDDLNTYLN